MFVKMNALDNDKDPSPGSRKQRFSVHIGNISLQAEKRDVIALFKEVGQVEDLYIVRAEEPKAFTYGFVRYSKLAEAKQAISDLDGWPLKGRRLAVQMAQENYYDVSDYIRHNPRRKSRGESDSSPEKPVTRACNVEALSEIKQLYDCMISSDNGKLQGMKWSDLVDSIQKQAYSLNSLYRQSPAKQETLDYSRLEESLSARLDQQTLSSNAKKENKYSSTSQKSTQVIKNYTNSINVKSNHNASTTVQKSLLQKTQNQNLIQGKSQSSAEVIQSSRTIPFPSTVLQRSSVATVTTNASTPMLNSVSSSHNAGRTLANQQTLIHSRMSEALSSSDKKVKEPQLGIHSLNSSSRLSQNSKDPSQALISMMRLSPEDKHRLPHLPRNNALYVDDLEVASDNGLMNKSCVLAASNSLREMLMRSEPKAEMQRPKISPFEHTVVSRGRGLSLLQNMTRNAEPRVGAVQKH